MRVDLVLENWQLFASGVWMTLQLTFLALATGFIVAASLIGFNFGGNFALFPAATADYFGDKSVGSNYGWVFTAYGDAGTAGPFHPRPRRQGRVGKSIRFRHGVAPSQGVARAEVRG